MLEERYNVLKAQTDELAASKEKEDEKAQTILEKEERIATLSGQLLEADEAFSLANEAIAQTNLISKEIDVL